MPKCKGYPASNTKTGSGTKTKSTVVKSVGGKTGTSSKGGGRKTTSASIVSQV